MKNQDEINEFYVQLESIGLEQARVKLAQGIYGEENKQLVKAWIESKSESSENQHKERGFSIAKEANQIAKKVIQYLWLHFLFLYWLS
jgi:hypothetical protein